MKTACSAPIKIIFKFICMKHNEHQLRQVAGFAEDIGADGYRIEPFTSRTVKHAKQFMSTLPRYQQYKQEELENNHLVPYKKQFLTPCHMLWDSINILWNGAVVPCCCDHEAEYSWGNLLKEKKFMRVWNSAKACQFRKEHTSGRFRESIKICKSCYLTNCK